MPARKAIVENREYAFFDSDGGVCFIPSRKDAEHLLRHTSGNYVLAYDRYGIVFDAQGVAVPPTTPTRVDGEKEPVVSARPARAKK